MAVRAATAGDLAEVHRLTRGYDGLPPAEPDAAFAARYARVLGRDDWALLVAPRGVAGEGLAGYALAQDYGPGLRRGFSVGRLHDLYVDPLVRRRGTGRALVEAVVAWCRTRPAPMILDWQARRDAVPFYDALGLAADYAGDTAEYPAYSIDLRT